MSREKRLRPTAAFAKAATRMVSGSPELALDTIRSQGVSMLRQAVTELRANFELVNESPWYVYMAEESLLKYKPHPDKIPFLRPDYIMAFHLNAKSGYDRMSISQQEIYEQGAQIITGEGGSTVEDRQRRGETILREGYNIVNFFNEFNDMPARYDKRNMFIFSQNDRAAIQKIYEGIGTEKPESLRETVRRTIPRFMWHPLDPPAAVPAEHAARLQELWSGYTSRDASLLIHPDRLKEGKAPLHMAMKAAETLESEGAEDLGYAIRTRVITDTLAMEKERFLGENREMPFFTEVLAASMTGELPKAPKNAHYDYASGIKETMVQTFARLQVEIDSGVEGPATKFLEKLTDIYEGKGASVLLAKSLTSSARTSDAFDEITILRGLRDRNFPWSVGIIDAMDQLKDGRVLTLEEVDKLAARLPEPTRETVPTAEKNIETISNIVGEEDMFSFRDKIRTDRVSANLDIDLDTIAESIDAVFHFNFGGKIRHLPFRLSFSGEKESFQMELLTHGPFKEETTEALRRTVLESIAKISEQKRQQEARQAGGRSITGIGPRKLAIADMGRPERMELYASRSTPREKQRAKAAKGVVYQTTKEGVERKRRKIKVRGLTEENVSNLLVQGKIKSISAEDLISKMHHMINLTLARGDMLGKRVSLEPAGSWAGKYKIYQINWVLDAGHTAMRVYMEDVGNNNFRLVGIMLKKSSNEQTRYLIQLAKRLRDNRITV